MKTKMKLKQKNNWITKTKTKTKKYIKTKITLPPTPVKLHSCNIRMYFCCY